MNIRIKKALIATTVLISVITTTACSGSKEASPSPSAVASIVPPSNSPVVAADPFEKYAEPVEVSVIYSRNPVSEEKFIPDSSYENNFNNDFYSEKLNIKPVVKWSAAAGDSFTQKYNLMIASNDLPDIFVLDGDGKQSTRSMLKKLVDSEMVEEVTGAFEKYASDDIKKYYQGFDNQALDYASFDGKMYGIPLQGDTYSNLPVLWIRKDWLDKLGLQEPKNMDDMLNIAKSFKEKDPDGNAKNDTYGLGMFNTFYKANDTFSAISIFNYFDGYPNSWIKNSEGKVVYGGVQPEAKKGLSILASMFKDGLIDPEFPLKDGNKIGESISSGKTGMMFGQWWNAWWPLGGSIDTDTKSDWKAYQLTSDGTVRASMSFPVTKFLVVRKGYKHPDLAVKLVNVTTAANDSKYPELTQRRLDLTAKYGADKTDPDTIFPRGGIGALDTTLKSYKKFESILSGKADTSILDIAESLIYPDLKANQDNPRKDVNKYKNYINWMYGIGSIANVKLDIKWNAFSGTTPSFDAKMPSLQDKQLQAYTKIVMGKEPIEYFDTFVKEWNSLGGDKITEEVNLELQKEGK
ncbi:MAG: extracellular solute-binding protein [Gorillibacterium sp.]|nr:extracellular solute-binding protein [Gorillibacterium sp.]